MAKAAALDTLQRLAFALELAELPPPPGFPPHADLATLAWSLRSLPGPLEEALADGRVAAMGTVPPGVIAFLDDAVAQRSNRLWIESEAAVPAGVLSLRALRGVGAKKVRVLWQELGITSVGELEYACRENRLVQLKGFGDKTQEAVLKQCHELAQSSKTMRRDHAERLLRPMMDVVTKAGGRAMIAGDWRLGCELVERAVVVANRTVTDIPDRVAVVVTNDDAWGRVVIEATGPLEHVQALQQRATTRGMQWSSLVGDEDEVYAALGLHSVVPEQRSAVMIERGHATPKLVTRADLQGSLHNHTNASDGIHTLAEMHAGATARGMAYLAITEHSVSSTYARGLSADALQAQHDDAWFGAVEGCVLLRGVESDILREGTLDYGDDVLSGCDVVVASGHQRYGLNRDDATARMLAAVRHRHTHVLGHPTGRLLLSRPPVDADWRAVLEACAACGVAIELNANPARLDFGVEWLGLAREMGVWVSIAADAHAVEELDYLDHGVAVARRAGLGPEHVLNAMALPALRLWLQSKRDGRRVAHG